MGVFGAYTRWAVVFLIIFVLFFLLCPGYGYFDTAAPSQISVTSYGATYGPYVAKPMHMGSSPHIMGGYGSSPSSL